MKRPANACGATAGPASKYSSPGAAQSYRAANEKSTTLINYHCTPEGRTAALARRVVDYLLARAMFAAYRDKNHRPWIALARIVAWISERRAV